jgi:hypothetical protein
MRMHLAFLVLFLAGCATTRELPATREQKLHQLAGRFIYDQPLQKIWPEARRLIVEAGYQPLESAEEYQLVTDWRDTISGSLAKVWMRYLVWGEQLDSDRCIIRFARSQITYIPNELRSTISTSGDSIYQRNPLKDSTPLGLHLRFKKNESRADSGTTQLGGRDLGMEWELLKRLKPSTAVQIEHLAERL